VKRKAPKSKKKKKGGKNAGCKKVDLVPPAPSPKDLYLSQGKKEGVFWDNGTDRGRTIRFKLQEWPFVEPPQDIQIPAGAKSKCFHIYQGAAKYYPFTYTVDPTLVPLNQPGPGDPSIIGDD
jgi:hypothetical protein